MRVQWNEAAFLSVTFLMCTRRSSVWLVLRSPCSFLWLYGCVCVSSWYIANFSWPMIYLWLKCKPICSHQRAANTVVLSEGAGETVVCTESTYGGKRLCSGINQKKNATTNWKKCSFTTLILQVKNDILHSNVMQSSPELISTFEKLEVTLSHEHQCQSVKLRDTSVLIKNNKNNKKQQYLKHWKCKLALKKHYT